MAFTFFFIVASLLVEMFSSCTLASATALFFSGNWGPNERPVMLHADQRRVAALVRMMHCVDRPCDDPHWHAPQRPCNGSVCAAFLPLQSSLSFCCLLVVVECLSSDRPAVSWFAYPPHIVATPWLLSATSFAAFFRFIRLTVQPPQSFVQGSSHILSALVVVNRQGLFQWLTSDGTSSLPFTTQALNK